MENIQYTTKFRNSNALNAEHGVKELMVRMVSYIVRIVIIKFGGNILGINVYARQLSTGVFC